MIYVLVNEETGEVVGYTEINGFDTDHDISDEELLDSRLDAAISDGNIPDGSYRWEKANRKFGILI